MASIEFTGTQQGMTEEQKKSLRDLLDGGTGELHHGDRAVDRDIASFELLCAPAERPVPAGPRTPSLLPVRRAAARQHGAMAEFSPRQIRRSHAQVRVRPSAISIRF
jgi:hypothetical protein